MKRIFSAGGIVLRLTPFVQDVPSGKNKIEVLVTQHSKHKGWDFPKGHKEIYESEEQAAIREVEEETGVKAEIVERVGQTQYFYHEEGSHSAPSDGASRDKQRVMKTVVYYLMKYIGQGEATTAFEVSDQKWLPTDKVEGQLTFKDTKELWRKVLVRIKNLEF